MAESTLSLTRGDLNEAVAQYLGYGRTSGNWSTRQSTNITESVNRGLREFYYGAMGPGGVPHEWSFLRPRASFTLWPTTTTAAITVSGAGNKTLTAASGTPFYPSMEKKAIVADTSGTSYTIDTYTSATVVTVTADASADDGDTFTITADGDYTLPEDFQSIEGPFTFTSATGPWHPIEVGNETEIRRRRAINASGGVPTLTAIDPLPYDSSSAQRWQVMVFPTPSTTYTLKYRYTRAPDAFTADADYPPGGSQYGEAIRALCEAAAEEEVEGRPGPKRALADRLVARAVAADTMNNTPETLGVMGDPSTYVGSRESNFDERWPGTTFTPSF